MVSIWHCKWLSLAKALQGGGKEARDGKEPYHRWPGQSDQGAPSHPDSGQPVKYIKQGNRTLLLVCLCLMKTAIWPREVCSNSGTPVSEEHVKMCCFCSFVQDWERKGPGISRRKQGCAPPWGACHSPAVHSVMLV